VVALIVYGSADFAFYNWNTFQSNSDQALVTANNGPSGWDEVVTMFTNTGFVSASMEADVLLSTGTICSDRVPVN
jgi:hypothetical protein